MVLDYVIYYKGTCDLLVVISECKINKSAKRKQIFRVNKSYKKNDEIGIICASHSLLVTLQKSLK